ncbi:hypothetical protein ON010_g7219 [Phytophthora cinnamomi]|nr:hypothetical protein ON010_g7219 [Phytophthora cinnamomi]
MSTASDISAFEHSVEPAPAEPLLRDKKWTYIQDSNSNTGQLADRRFAVVGMWLVAAGYALCFSSLHNLP